jgi:hypothetical protein
MTCKRTNTSGVRGIEVGTHVRPQNRVELRSVIDKHGVITRGSVISLSFLQGHHFRVSQIAVS